MSPEELEDAGNRALIAAVREAQVDPRPAIPHEVARAEMLQQLAELRRRVAALPPS